MLLKVTREEVLATFDGDLISALEERVAHADCAQDQEVAAWAIDEIKRLRRDAIPQQSLLAVVKKFDMGDPTITPEKFAVAFDDLRAVAYDQPDHCRPWLTTEGEPTE